MGLSSWQDWFNQPKRATVQEVIRPQTMGGRYASQLHNIMHRSAPEDFEEKYEKIKPYLCLSFISWPIFWVYKGLDWNYNRAQMQLPDFINRVHLQAKVMQFAILLTGMAAASYGAGQKMRNIKNVSRNPRHL